MKRSVFITFIAIFGIVRASAEVPATTVFQSGDEGYKVFRIPAIVAAANGDLLAFCEARQGGDASEIDLVLKRSSDDGKSWGPIEMVQESDDFRDLFGEDPPEITVGNPAPVVDHLSQENPGRLWLPFTLENDRVFVTHSDDFGKTWAPRREITKDVKKEEWGWYATGPVHSIQLQRAPRRGRLVIPCDHRLSDDGEDRGPNGVHAIISDDHGKTWRLGALDETYEDGLNANETTVVELNDGSLYFNTRDQNGSAPGTRGEAWSRDGGETFESGSEEWENFRPVGGEALDPPVVQCALLRADKNFILFSGPDENGPTGKGRSDLGIRYSTDEAKTWQDGPLIHIGPAAYSDMVRLDDGRIGVLFEAGDSGQKNAYQRIDFAMIDSRSLVRKRSGAISWNQLAPIPDKIGFAGPFAGTIEGNLIAAGGANFPEAPPWENGKKVWHDRVFVLPAGSEEWQTSDSKLPQALAYGVSISLPKRKSIAMLGGSDQSNAPTASAFELRLEKGKVITEKLPDLPTPLAEMSGVGLGSELYLFSGRSTEGTARKAFRLDLDATSPAWEEIRWSKEARGRMHSVAGVRDGKIFLFAGRDIMSDGEIEHPGDRMKVHSLDFLRDCWRLDPESLEWTRLAELPKGLSAAPMTAVPAGDADLLMLGGVNVRFLKRQIADRPELNGQGHEHPGFPRAIWAYDTGVDTWRIAGWLPRKVAVPVTVPVVMTGPGSFVIPSGEIKPGVRTTQVIQGKIGKK